MNLPIKDATGDHSTADNNNLTTSFHNLHAEVKGPVGTSGKTLKVVTDVDPMTPIKNNIPPISPNNGNIGDKEGIAEDIPENCLKRVKRTYDLTNLVTRLDEVELVDPCIDGLIANNSDSRSDSDCSDDERRSDVEYFSQLALGFEMQLTPDSDEVEFGVGSIIFDAGDYMPASISTTPDLTTSVTTFDPHSPVLAFPICQDTPEDVVEGEEGDEKDRWKHFASLRKQDDWVGIDDIPLTPYVPLNKDVEPSSADLNDLARIREALKSKKPLCGGHFAKSFDSVGPGRQTDDVWVKPTMRGVQADKIKF